MERALTYPAFDGPTATDGFCGAGGSTQGLYLAGFSPSLALNHSQIAIDTHSANFPDTEHICADISNYDMRRLKKTDVAWFSPICTEISPAGRRKRIREQLELLEYGPIRKETFERTRTTFHDVIRATEVHRYKIVMVENVVEVATDWELFDWWLSGMLLLGYKVQFVCVSAAHIRGEDNDPAAQYRCRLVMVFRQEGIRKPDLEPRPQAWCESCGKDVRAKQIWRPHMKLRRKIGKYGQQYDYRCPNSACRHQIVEPYVIGAETVIDWSDPGVLIGERHLHPGLAPLVPNTRRKIALGLQMYGGHDGAEAAPFITVLRNHSTVSGMAEPLSTISAGGNHHGLTIPPGATLPVTSAGIHRALVIPYRKGAKPHPVTEPISTLTTHDQHGLLTSMAAEIDQCHYRTILPREQLRAQRFPDSYIVHGNRGEQTMQAGNAVPVNVAQWIGSQVIKVL